MVNRLDAIDRAKDLAMNGLSAGEIHRELVKEGMGHPLHPSEIQRLMLKVDMVRYLPPKPQRFHFARCVGVIAVVLGLGAILLGYSSPGMRKRGPGRMGVIALVLGIVLVAKPSASKTEL
jgi:hypothetical protein